MEYDPKLPTGLLSQFRCKVCAATGILKSLVKHTAECSAPEVVFTFGPRLARAILLRVVERKEGENDVGEGLVFSWAQLKQEFPEAAKAAEIALAFLIQQKGEERGMKGIKVELDQLLAARSLRGKATHKMTSAGELVAQLKLPGLKSESPAPASGKPTQGKLFSDRLLVPRKPPVTARPPATKPQKKWYMDFARNFANRPTGTGGHR